MYLASSSKCTDKLIITIVIVLDDDEHTAACALDAHIRPVLV